MIQGIKNIWSTRYFVVVVMITLFVVISIQLQQVEASSFLGNLNSVKINLDNVEVVDSSPGEETSDILTLDVFFGVDNPTNLTLTISKIDYTLLANGQSLGDGRADYMDIPFDGRPQLLPGHTTTIVSPFEIPRSNPALAHFNIGNLSGSDINWEAEGTADIEHQQIQFTSTTQTL